MSFERLKERYNAGRITVSMLRFYVRKGIISREQFTEITGEEY